MKSIIVTIRRVEGEAFFVRWTPVGSDEVLGLVPVGSAKYAEQLKANLDSGMSPTLAVRAIYTPRRRRRPGWKHFGVEAGKLGGQARAKSLSAKKRRAIAAAGAAARWGKTNGQPQEGKAK